MGNLKDLLKGAKGVAKNKLKKILKAFAIKIKYLLPILLILLLIFGLISIILPFNDGVYKEGDIKNAPYAASTYTKDVTIGEDGIKTKITAEDLWKKMIKKGSNVNKYLDSPKQLEKLMNAEIVTQYPKFGKGDLDGSIIFKRGDKTLKYLSEEKFRQYIDDDNKNGTDVAADYFTIDGAGNVLMSKWTKTTTVETVTQNGQTVSSNTYVNYYVDTISINYKSVIQKYTMPFEYLWDLLITTKGKKFVLELADFVIEDTMIEITGVEKPSRSEDEQTSSEDVSVSVPVESVDPTTGEKTTEMSTETQTKTTTVKTIMESNNVEAELTEADTWIVNYTKDGGVKPKVSSDSNEKNFITLINNHYYTRENFIDNYKLLFGLLEKNDSTANMVGLTKYLLYKLTDDKRFETEFKFAEYEPGDMNSISFGSGGASYESLNLTDHDLQILYKITSAERGGGTQQQQEYVVSVILNRVLSSKFPNTVEGVVFAPMQFQPTRNGAYDKAVPSSTTIAAVNNVVQNGDTSQCAVYFMTPGAALGQQSWLSNCEYLFNDTDEGLKNTNTNGSHNFYTREDIKNELQQYVIAGNDSIVESAVSIHKYVRENGYTYEQAGVTLPNTSSRTIDCSSYVTWVLLNAGVGGFSNGMYQWSSTSFNNNAYGWQTVSVQEAKPGDILVYSSHVEIVAATGNSDKFIVYNCGGDSSINATGTSDLPETSLSAHRKSQVIKVLRVPQKGGG